VKYGIDPQEAKLKKGQKPMGEEWGTEDFENWGLTSFVNSGLHFDGSVETEPGNYMGFYDNVWAVLNGHAKKEVSDDQVRTVIRIIELAFESNKQQATITYSE
jgi:hypothetical protein